MDKITKKQLLLAAKMLELASDQFTNHGCNDVEESIFNDWTLEEKEAFAKEYFEWNGDEQEDRTHLHIGDSEIMSFLAEKLTKI